MYESPIKITQIYEQTGSELVEQQEAYIFSVVKRMYVDVDKDELIKALAYDRGQYDKGYIDGRAARDAEIVRCKDCKHSFGYTTGYGLYGGLTCEALDRDVDDEFFCSYGERKEDEDR